MSDEEAKPLITTFEERQHYYERKNVREKHFVLKVVQLFSVDKQSLTP